MSSFVTVLCTQFSGAAITFDGGNGAGLGFGDAAITLKVTNVGDVFGTSRSSD